MFISDTFTVPFGDVGDDDDDGVGFVKDDVGTSDDDEYTGSIGG